MDDRSTVHLTAMKAASGPMPRGADWCHEIKWDGIRTLATVEGDRLRLASSTDKPLDRRFPQIAALDLGLPNNSVIDGEIVGFADGKVSFEALAAGRASTMLVVFDLLRFDGLDTWTLPWHERRRVLDDVLSEGPQWRTSSVHDDPDALWSTVVAANLEGVMSKRRESAYEPGRRSPAWRKTKAVRRQEFVVVGATTGSGARSHTFGALVLAINDGDGLRWAGNVGTGFSDVGLRHWSTHIERHRRNTTALDDASGLKDVTWLDPVGVIEVEFTAWTEHGHVRHPSAIGPRDDVDPSCVVREPE